jgi:hypothetical protein
VRRGEEGAGVVGDERLLGDQVLDAGAEDRPIRSILAERFEIGLPQRPLPDEVLVRTRQNA